MHDPTSAVQPRIRHEAPDDRVAWRRQEACPGSPQVRWDDFVVAWQIPGIARRQGLGSAKKVRAGS